MPPFEQVVERHGGDVWRFCASQVGPARADDVFQETMLAALAAYPALRDPAAVRPWLLRIAARKAVDLFRTTGREAVPVPEPDDGPATPEPALTDDGLWAQVRALPAKQRRALALRYVLDLRYAEIGEAMETTAEAARRNVFEALRALRRSVPSHVRDDSVVW